MLMVQQEFSRLISEKAVDHNHNLLFTWLKSYGFDVQKYISQGESKTKINSLYNSLAECYLI